MLPQSYLIAFKHIKFKYFSNTLKDSSFYVSRCILQPVAQELDKVLVLHGRKKRPKNVYFMGDALKTRDIR